jgi:hypothetical protein
MRKSRREVTRNPASEVLFFFPVLRFDMSSPYGDGRYRSAPKPGKEKQKTDDYRSAILMVHRLILPFCVHAGNAKNPAGGYAEKRLPDYKYWALGKF